MNLLRIKKVLLFAIVFTPFCISGYSIRNDVTSCYTVICKKNTINNSNNGELPKEVKYELIWNKDIKSYFLKFTNHGGKRYIITFEYYSAYLNKYVKNVGSIGPYQSETMSCGEKGKYRNLEIQPN